jgi:hypothetical protein
MQRKTTAARGLTATINTKASDFFSEQQGAIGEKNKSVAALRQLIAWRRETGCGLGRNGWTYRPMKFSRQILGGV